MWEVQHVNTIINLSGNEEKYHKCNIRRASVTFVDGELSVSIATEDYSDKFVRLWERLRR